jgi:plasmid stabilization system protein ParE
MAYQIEITTPAENDLYAAFERIRAVAPSVAERWLRGIFKTIFSLKEMPDRCPLAPESETLGLEIRHLLHGKRTSLYRIIFDVQNESLVRILRVWHGNRDRIQEEDLE